VLLEDKASALIEAGAPEESVRRVRLARAELLASLGRSAVEAGSLDKGADRLVEALASYAALGESDSVPAYAARQKLAIAVAERDPDLASEHHEAVFTGLRGLLGPTDERTLSALVAFSSHLGSRELDRALEILDAGMEDVSTAELSRGVRDVVIHRASAAHAVGRRALAAGEPERADDLLQSAGADLARIGEEESSLSAHILLDLAGAAVGSDPELAMKRYRGALASLRKTAGWKDRDTIVAVLALARLLANEDLDEALSLLDEALAELEEADGDAAAIAAIRRGRAEVHLYASRAVEAGDRTEAAELLERGLDILERLGERDTLLGYGFVHDLAMVVEDSDPDLATKRFEAVANGLHDLVGPADENTVNAWLSLSRHLASLDPERAQETLKDALEALEAAAAPAAARERIKAQLGQLSLQVQNDQD